MHLCHYENNRPVADFYCDGCNEDHELKSISGSFGKTITDGQNDKMIMRITLLDNPNFFFMTYDGYTVTNLMLVPRFFFTPDLAVRRTPLAHSARHAGWVGCNINIEALPSFSKLFVVKDGVVLERKQVVEGYAHIQQLKTDNLNNRGWLLDTMKVVEAIHGDIFTLKQVYTFEETLQMRHLDNNFIKDKLRQQLQMLRDKGQIEFLGNGKYRKVHIGMRK